MRTGSVYERPTSALPTAAIAGSWLPTPLASDGEKGGPNQRGGSGDLRLSSAVHLLPTPAARDGDGRGASDPERRRELGRQVGLDDVATHLLPTPTAMDAHGSRGYRPDETPYTGTAGVTLTDAALSSSGAHTPPQSRDGNEPSDGELPGQLSLDEAASD